MLTYPLAGPSSSAVLFWEWKLHSIHSKYVLPDEVACCPLGHEFTEMGVTEQHFCLTGNQTHGLRQMSQTALNTFLSNYKCCIRTADRRERHLPFLTKNVTHRRRILWVVLSEETGANPAPCSFWQKALGKGSWSSHVLSTYNQGKDSSLLQTGLLLNELEKPDLGYLCNICVAASDAQSRLSPKNDRGKIFPKDIKYQE